MTDLQVLVRSTLERANSYAWTFQGMGMLRLHLGDNCRLHIWDHERAVPGVSMIHDHLQWGLSSTVVSGTLVNRKYRELFSVKPNYMVKTIRAGIGCVDVKAPAPCYIMESTRERIPAGGTYEQEPYEIHQTCATRGTVTFMRKTPSGNENARVFWPIGTEWGSAEPRAATPLEVAEMVDHALANWRV